MRHASLAEWLSWLETLHPKAIDLGLDRVRIVQRKLGLETPHFKTVLVAGTNGKGTAATILANLLRLAGYKTGLYTSPHVLNYRERVQVDGQMAGESEICEALEAIDQARGEISLTYFEFGTLAAAWLFAREQCQFAVMEVGLGGRLDATNVFEPALGIITSVSIDHVDWLGDNRETIGVEKAGIMRRGVTCIIGDPEPPKSILKTAEQLAAPVLRVNEDFNVQYVPGSDRWHLDYGEISIPDLPVGRLPGWCQVVNAACATVAARLITGDRLDSDAFRTVLAETTLPGRFQVVEDAITTVFDVAHNPAAAKVLAGNLRNRRMQVSTIALVGFFGDKDIAGFVAALGDQIASWHLLPLRGSRAADPENTAAIIRRQTGCDEIFVHQSAETAIGAARQNAVDTGSQLLVTGSFETVGVALASEIYSAKSGSSS